MQAVILAGGKGTRLKPFTKNFPKPLVPLDDLPILEIELRQLKYYGFTHVVLAVNHLAELIKSFFGDGRRLGIHISYSEEKKEMGTAGPLALINNLADNFLVMNGDLLTTIDYKNLYQQHLKNQNDLTIPVYKKEVKIDLGILKIKNDKLINYLEKPTYNFDVSMGVYVFNKRVIKEINKNKKMDIPDLILKMKKKKKKIRIFKGNYYWLDIGRVEDYEKATEIFSKKRKEFLLDE